MQQQAEMDAASQMAEAAGEAAPALRAVDETELGAEIVGDAA
jgi:hypothetical protein